MLNEKRRSPKISYLWQSVTAELPLSKVTATSLHMRSVIDAFQKRGHQVRIISLVKGQPHWSDDGVTWQKIAPAKKSLPFRVVESLIRALQSRLNLPYFNVTPDDAKALKCALLELVENEQLRQRMEQVAQRKALREHSWDLVALKIENIMYALLDRSAPEKEN